MSGYQCCCLGFRPVRSIGCVLEKWGRRNNGSLLIVRVNLLRHRFSYILPLPYRDTSLLRQNRISSREGYAGPPALNAAYVIR